MISCRALQDKSIYVTADGKLMPCCFLQTRIYMAPELIKLLYDKPKFQCLVDSWTSDSPYPRCVEMCGENTQDTWHTEQMNRQIKFISKNNKD